MPDWALGLVWEMRRGRQVIISGQVRDRWWLRRRPAALQELLCGVLAASGAEAVGWWTPVDGLTFPVPQHRSRFDELVASLPPLDHTDAAPANADEEQDLFSEGPSGQDPFAPEPFGQDPFPQAGGAPALPGDGAPTRRGEARRAARAGLLAAARAPKLTLLEDVTAVVRRLAASPDSATAFVFQDVDLALPPHDPGYDLGFLRLRAAMDGAVVPHAVEAKPSAPQPRNPVLVVTGDLSRLPDWFSKEDPRIATLAVGRPDQTERRLWLSILGQSFNGIETATTAEIEAIVGATDGMAAWDLDALAKSSYLRRTPIQEPVKLLESHRLNVSVDPWSQLDRDRVVKAGERLSESVLGQQCAVAQVADALQSAYVGVGFGESGAARPRGALFFVGPTGVGKTELAKGVAKLIFGDPSAYARFDMSEYQQEHSAERLAGAPPGFTGHDQGGELTRRMQERPFSVLLFDEIEKAHPTVLDKFLQILEDGRLTDGRGQTAYFSHSLIIFTSNTGADRLADLLAFEEEGGEPSYETLETHFTEAVEAKFSAIERPELFGRLRPGVVVFDMLRPEYICEIADRLLAQLAASVLERQQVTVGYDRSSIHAWILKRMQAPERRAYGGRQIRNELELIKGEIVRHFVGSPAVPGARIDVSMVDGAVQVSLSGTDSPSGHSWGVE
ncbi:AAA family ATPase [Streptomyces sp. RKAG293]|uniref:AAA family ATPase n=1 Tax=Streptomyces sp. RKAG293 TaxID=2893403 RepID=UPI002034123A|nr:AAA family ATPase [Streptomyces sp. RKAG293]MCM2422616.1 AAA family ATPase [Streptomyces sp. RKAG293]